MKKHCFTLVRLLCLSLALLAPACSKPTTPLATHLTSTPTPAQTPTHAILPTATPTLFPAYTETPEPESIQILPTTLQQPGAWRLHLPYTDPGARELIGAASDGYRLDPGFRVASIDALYYWIGIGDSVKEYQRIEHRDTGFWRFDSQVSADAVLALVQSIAALHPQPAVVNSTTHSDDYPFWTIELSSEAGEKVLLYSSSNTSNFAPWNVIYNGKVYVQFDGQIAAALPALFTINEGQTLATLTYRDLEEGYLTVVNDEQPPDQLTSGFSGLLPVSRYFVYTADPEAGELRGRMLAFAWSDGLANRAIGPLTKLEKIEIESEDGHAIACTYEVIQSLPESSTWDFICPAGKPGEAATYRFPFRVTFTNEINPAYVVSGELYGYWQREKSLLAAPFPEQFEGIWAASPEARDLLSDHLAFVNRPVAAVDPAAGNLDHLWKSDVTLLGRMQTGERILRYTATIQVEIQDSKLVHWDLDRSELLGLLQDVIEQPLTRRFLEEDDNLVLNLYYAETSANPLIPAEKLQPCAGLPAADSPAPGQPLPSPGQPLRGFSFNQYWSVYSAQVLLVGGSLRINQLFLAPADAEDALWLALLPAELQPQDAVPFRSITAGYRAQEVTIYWGRDASSAEDALYFARFEGWDATRNPEEHSITLNHVLLAITPEGRLALVRCDAP